MPVGPADREEGDAPGHRFDASVLILKLGVATLFHSVEIPLRSKAPGLVLGRVVVDVPMKLPAQVVLFQPKRFSLQIFVV